MASNFDFLKEIDKELFEIIEDAQKLFRSEYFNQTVIQVRIYAEKMAKKILNSNDSTQTFDNILNCLKDKIQTEREKEFIDDLFFIKKQGNNCAHGEDTTALIALEVLRRAFEVGINYAYSKTKDEKIDKLIFDETLLITQKPQNENKIIDKYLKHITDVKPITARQCIKALAQIGVAKPQYIPRILLCLHEADLSKYKDSMRPLIERDIAETEQRLRGLKK